MSSRNSSRANGLSLTDEQLDLQVEAFPLAVVAMLDSEVQGLMLGSLERIGGTPAILWGLGVARKGKHGPAALKAMTGELSRRGRDLVPRRGRARRDAALAAELLHAARRATRTSCRDRVTSPTAKTARGVAASPSASASSRHFDDRGFTVAVKSRKPTCVPILDASAVKATGGAKIVSLVGDLDATAARR